MEENYNYSEDEQTITDTSISQERWPEDDGVSEKDKSETLKETSNSDKDKDVTQTSNKLLEFIYENLQYWANYRAPSDKREST